MAHGSALPDLWSDRRCCHLFLPVPAAMALAQAVRSAAYQGRTLTCNAMEGRPVGAPGTAHWRAGRCTRRCAGQWSCAPVPGIWGVSLFTEIQGWGKSKVGKWRA